MESYSLYQLNEYIRRVIALNFREPLWIEAEIVQCKDSKGNIYLELAEKDEKSNEVIAQASAAIWYKNYQFIKRKLGDVIFQLLKDGTQVRLKCRVDFNERYGFKLFVEDIDPNYTFGQLELKRQRIINQLHEEGLIELNRSLILPSVIQRLAVISSPTAAGYQDFFNQLKNNSYGYQYKIDLYESAVQGQKVEGDTCHAIAEIMSRSNEYDAAVIIRGGGSKLDLAAYDNYEIAKSIATSEVPFIIGIGHDIDNTVADIVSCLSVKTPTAVADYLLESSLHFESSMEHNTQVILQKAMHTINHESQLLKSLEDKLDMLSHQMIILQENTLDQLGLRLQNDISNILERASMRISNIEQTIDHLDPQQVMQRGYAYMMKGQSVVNSIKQVNTDDSLVAHFTDGHVETKVIKTENG